LAGAKFMLELNGHLRSILRPKFALSF